MRTFPGLVLALALGAALPESAGAQALLGTWDGSTYLAPAGAFGFTPPPLAGGAQSISVSDAQPDARSQLVQVGDLHCRRMLVVETRGELTRETLEAWVSREVVSSLDPQRVDSLVRSGRETRFGKAVELRWVGRGAAPCAEVSLANGRRGEPTQPDADVGMVIFHLPGRFIRLVYLLGRSSQPALLEGVARGPMDAMLDAMVAGFNPVP